MKAKEQCSREGCTRPVRCKGLCASHYQTQWARKKKGRENMPLAWCGRNYATRPHSTEKRKDWPEIIGARKSGMTAKEICAKFGLLEGQLYSRLKREGLSYRDTPERRKLLREIRHWAKRGWGRARIARKVGISHLALSAICRRHKIETTRKRYHPNIFNGEELKLTDKGRKFRRMRKSDDNLGRKLRKARIKAGLSQWQLADKIGAAQQQITDYELGKRRPRKDRLEQLCKILGLRL